MEIILETGVALSPCGEKEPFVSLSIALAQHSYGYRFTPHRCTAFGYEGTATARFYNHISALAKPLGQRAKPIDTYLRIETDPLSTLDQKRSAYKALKAWASALPSID